MISSREIELVQIYIKKSNEFEKRGMLGASVEVLKQAKYLSEIIEQAAEEQIKEFEKRTEQKSTARAAD